MLTHLAIRDIVLIERLDIDFGPGLSVLTGETGAGKSILLDALSLALGARGDAALVRHGAEQGQVTAVFDVPAGHAVRKLMEENDIPDEGPLILKRVQSADGRTRASINDQPVGVTLMRAFGHQLVEIHGQHDERALVDPQAHLTLLDAFGGHGSLAARVAAAWRTWREREEALAAQRKAIAEAEREADYLRDSVAELSALDPQPGEETELANRRTTMMQAEKIATEISEANDYLSGSASPMPEISALLRRLERKAESVPGLLDASIEALDATLNAFSEAQNAVETALHATEFDPRELEETETRLFALRAAGRKYSVAVDELADLAVRMADALADVDAGADKLAKLEAGTREAEKAYRALAAELSEARLKSAGELAGAVMAELPALKLERAQFIVSLESDPEKPTVRGFDMAEFHVRTNPGARPGAMMKVASGGELSRFLLALKVALADRGSAPTLVFDEIDTGVGGAVADAIGQRLRRLAQTVQVLSVTHAPQVAARAASHLLISKGAVDGERVATRVETMDEAARAEEIARMLAGASITDEARAAAQRLLTETS
ncbi:MAG: DNA repair protein RecN [Brucellaceae bacterium]|nr:DNA repair protein RecN [Brucellaceae bacterium]